MSAVRFGKAQKAVALVPMALLSAAWTASLASSGSVLAENEALPDGTSVPGSAIEDPASVSVPGMIGLGIPEGSGTEIVDAASTSGIPAAALAAYQRADTVINAADEACKIPWELIAAIGRVESNHGRYGGNVLGKDGVARPGVFGIALDGTNNTKTIRDTDAGQYDNDKVYDRAVGPMQFIPSTWAVVGVDADGDAKRNPQDIDDAALAAAVYLCSGTDDLSKDAGQRTAVYRYNHSQAYVDLVLSVMAAYMEGDYSAVPNSTTSAIYFTPDYNYTLPKSKGYKPLPAYGSTLTPVSPAPGYGSENPSGPPTGENPDGTPETPPVTGGTKSLLDGVTKPLETLINGLIQPSPSPGPSPNPITAPVIQLLTRVEAEAACLLKGYTALLTPVKYKECMATYGF